MAGPKAVSTAWSRPHVLTLGSGFLTCLCYYTNKIGFNLINDTPMKTVLTLRLTLE